MRLCLGLLCLLTASAREPKDWTRPDGQVINPAQLQLDKTACEGEVEKAAVSGQAKSTINAPLGMDNQDMRVFKGCMATRGYLAAPGN
jgi:hypothetical protein